MKRYKNGDRCPCCGTVLEGKSADWLRDFSELVDMLHIPEWPALEHWFPVPELTEEDNGDGT